jgi:pimeloyl-ACP methyl ester carboxylesterase
MTQHLVFSHGNSFPASTYRLMLDEWRARGWQVHAIEKIGHDPAYPVTDNWPHLVQQLQDFTQSIAAQHNTQVYLVGHSLGGFLSAMAGVRMHHLVRGVLLLDAPLIGGWRAQLLRWAKRSGRMHAYSPGAISQRRRVLWDSEDEVMSHFFDKGKFARWHPEVLRDYVANGTHAIGEGGQRALSFDRDIETAIYNTLPHNLPSLLKRHPLKCSVAFVGGTRSREMRLVGSDLTDQVSKGRVTWLDGSHLFPMEKPLATAAAVEAALRNLGATPV